MTPTLMKGREGARGSGKEVYKGWVPIASIIDVKGCEE
jgi:hypothetical protein